ncbi:hypothetical protein HK097_008378 [Rhizophlyctis rosea]|uniref:Uncharacterized protein n=1 Tax=Rhizophlyctis rosea TaxID=64517 RepID=A0AAD5SD16_9FUNG|nr:hypothetical protein HK097_008378 [Rhizophlyctis rosea]
MATIRYLLVESQNRDTIIAYEPAIEAITDRLAGRVVTETTIKNFASSNTPTHGTTHDPGNALVDFPWSNKGRKEPTLEGISIDASKFNVTDMVALET